MLLGDGRDGLKRECVEFWIANRFAINCFGPVGDRGFEGGGIGEVDELNRDSPLWKRVVEKVIGSAVEGSGGNDLVTLLGKGGKGQSNGGLTGSGCQACGSAF